MNAQKDLAIVILVGGKSIRFGIETSVIDILGKPLILHQIETLSKFDEDIYLITHTEYQINAYYNQIDFPRDIQFIIDDREIISDPEIRTPLLGIYTALKELNNIGFKNAFLLSGDMPLIKAEVIELLIEELEGYDCCIPKWNNGFLEPLFAIYPVKESFEKTKSNLENKNFTLTDILRANWNINYISVEEKIKPLDKNLVSLININGPIDLEKVLTLF